MPKKKNSNPSGRKPVVQRNRHGLPRVSADDDLGALFGSEAEDRPDPAGSFAEAVASGKIDRGPGTEALILRRADGGGRQPAPPVGRRPAGRPIPEAELDLHGARGREAEARTDLFVRSARQRGLKLLLIITGRGLHSPGGVAVLQEAVEGRLRELKAQGVIRTFAWEKKTRQQSGAILVSLP